MFCTRRSPEIGISKTTLLHPLTTVDGRTLERSGPLTLIAIFCDWTRKIATFAFLSTLFASVLWPFLTSSLTHYRRLSPNTPYNLCTQRRAGKWDAISTCGSYSDARLSSPGYSPILRSSGGTSSVVVTITLRFEDLPMLSSGLLPWTLPYKKQRSHARAKVASWSG